MVMEQNTVAVGVFTSDEQARKAVEELRAAGYNDDEVGYLHRVDVDTTISEGDVAANAATGAIGGGVLGGVIGAVASLLIPGVGPAIAGGILAATLLGAATGSIMGMLTATGIPEGDARFYQHELEAGHTVLVVKSGAGVADAANILRRNGAYDATTRAATVNPSQTMRPQANLEPSDNDPRDNTAR